MQPFCSAEAKSITYLFWMFICSFRYPAYKAQSPYFDLWPVWLYLIFPHYLINGTIFEKKKSYWTSNVCFDFPTTFVWNISHFKKYWTSYKNVYWSSCKVPGILVRFQWHLSFLDIFSKNTQNIKFHENPSMRTDRHDEANNRFSQFCESA